MHQSMIIGCHALLVSKNICSTFAYLTFGHVYECLRTYLSAKKDNDIQFKHPEGQENYKSFA